ncbi:MAG: hypothetical protein QNJ51_22440 [Calothrix sp. MO_167.B12]|nr:hypothetical protein [Calothrix sp. MO_167.B12]
MSLTYTSHNLTSFHNYTAHELKYDSFDDLIGDLKQIVGFKIDIVDVNYSNGSWSATYSDIPGTTSFIGNWTLDGLMSQAGDLYSRGYRAIDQGIGEWYDQPLYFGIMYNPPAYMSDPLSYTLDKIQTHNVALSMADTIGDNGYI